MEGEPTEQEKPKRKLWRDMTPEEQQAVRLGPIGESTMPEGLTLVVRDKMGIADERWAMAIARSEAAYGQFFGMPVLTNFHQITSEEVQETLRRGLDECEKIIGDTKVPAEIRLEAADRMSVLSKAMEEHIRLSVELAEKSRQPAGSTKQKRLPPNVNLQVNVAAPAPPTPPPAPARIDTLKPAALLPEE